MAHHIERAKLGGEIEVDSAGTGDWHIGAPPDSRAAAEASSRGITMRSLARQIRIEDFDRFDLILAMDSSNVRDLEGLAPDDDRRAKIRLLRQFDPGVGDLDHGDLDLGDMDLGDWDLGDMEVPDPYYGGPEGFALVFDLVDIACSGLLEHIRAGRLGQI